MKLVIVIECDNLDELFAVGVKDLMNVFIPKYFNVETKDIKKCTFEELRRDGKIISTHDALWHKGEYEVIKHKDNYPASADTKVEGNGG